jgi:hypothetical protein
VIIRLIAVFLLFGFVAAPMARAAAADDTLNTLERGEAYNIYYGGDSDGASYMVRRVKIVRIQQINGIDFLVFINDSGFNAKAKEGYILFSTVKAIVPDSTFTIIGNERAQ